MEGCSKISHCKLHRKIANRRAPDGNQCYFILIQKEKRKQGKAQGKAQDSKQKKNKEKKKEE